MSRIRADRYTNREGTGAPTFSSGVNVVGVTSMSGDLAVTNGTITGPSQLTISGITSSISDTAVDVFVYDTSKDSDGGDWRYRTQNTSWYNETLNTATRGSRKEFPAVAVIVAESDKVTIYDGDDPDLPMWMVFNRSSLSSSTSWTFLGGTPNSFLTSVSAINGLMVVGSDQTSSAGFAATMLLNFLSETVSIRYVSGSFSTSNSAFIYRNLVQSFTASSSGAIISGLTNDVAMTVLPNAPIDDATGLPIPTIAVATDGGVSVIKDDGNVVDITASAGSSYSSAKFISISSDGFLVFPQHGSSATTGEYSLMTIPIPSSDRTTQTNSGNATDKYIFNDTSSALTSLPHGLGLSQNGALIISGTQFLNYPNGLAILDENPTSLSNAMVAYIKSDHNTGWMHGDIKLATLSDTDATNQTGGTVADRSIKNTSVNVTGTITRTAVATGAELVGYSGFSASNYLEQPYNSELAPGTSSYSVVAWFKTGPTTSDQYIFDRSSDGSPRALMLIRASNSGSPNTIQFYHQNAAGDTTDLTATDITVTDDVWHQVVGLFDGSVYKLYVDARASTITGSPVRDVDNTDSPVLKLGIRYSNTAPLTGNLALFRYSKTAPSPEQVKKMYEDEKYLFQENSQATLYGSSDAVTALAYDDTTNILHVGTSAGRSEFQGLRRINNTTVGITSAISASNELVAEQ